MKNKKILIYSLIGILIFVFGFPGVSNSLRYKFEKIFSEPHTFFYGTGIGFSKEPGPYYDEQYDTDDLEAVTLNNIGNGRVVVYGKVTNSADPLIVILNQKVLYSGGMSNSDVPSFYKRYYINKYFAVELTDFKQGSNELLLTSGNAVKKIKIQIR